MVRSLDVDGAVCQNDSKMQPAYRRMTTVYTWITLVIIVVAAVSAESPKSGKFSQPEHLQIDIIRPHRYPKHKMRTIIMPAAVGGIKRYRDPSVCLSVCPRLGYRHAGCMAQLRGLYSLYAGSIASITVPNFHNTFAKKFLRVFVRQ